MVTTLEVVYVLAQQDRQGAAHSLHSTAVGCTKLPVLDGSAVQKTDQGSSGRCDTSRPMNLLPSHPNQKTTLPCPAHALQSFWGGCLYFTRHALLSRGPIYVLYRMMASPVDTSPILFPVASLHLLPWE